ncbi:DNA-directed RNA polymerase subunit beta' [bacterium]|nr:DNA-directed RNA polymerase subunit beta' [bacterium]
MFLSNASEFDFLEIGLASPDRIRFWSYGEVEKPETINYRTFKPERRGLFCEKIFGPVKDWECSCGKYRRVRYRGIVCERCGVEVTHSKVRRERMGHIELAADVCHIWFLKGVPSYIGLLLDISARQLEEVVYYDSYIVTDLDPSLEGQLALRQTIGIVEYSELKSKFGNGFKAEMGASAIKKLLSELHLKELAIQIRESLSDAKGQKRLKLTKRLRIVESLLKSGNQPEWMILEVIPVMPPDLRPMVQLEGGRFATSDLNDLYRRVVNRNNRLKRLIDIGAPDMIVRNEKRMLQEAVDVLISNGKRGRSVTGSNGRPLKSLGNIIEGKQGRFRQNLLGKRVDYSARSVIVVGPHLKFNQCGLPKEMALELFKPFIVRKLVDYGHVSNVKSAKRKIERREVVVWDVLEEVIKGQPVLLNRAPTLHRLGIQAFEPILVEGSAIQVHPLVCYAFNADFDGDQMAVHVPLSLEAQAECRLLIMAVNNILSPSSGKAIVTPTQDMVLGIYFLTSENEASLLGKGKYFVSVDEAFRALEAKAIAIQSQIVVKVESERYTTTMGRVIFNSEVNAVLKRRGFTSIPFVNEIVGKKRLGELVSKWFSAFGNDVIVELLDRLKSIGFHYSTLSGISISIDDLRIPPDKAKLLAKAEREIGVLVKQRESGALPAREMQLRSNDVWRETTHAVSNSLENTLGQLNNLYIMAHSGARGNIDQVRQLAGMRGLMSDAQGRIVDIPIKSNFKEGLTLTEYFISSYGARKGLVDTALRTADSGYLTRRLVDVAQDVMISEPDCGVSEGVDVQAVKDGINIIVPLVDLMVGRVSVHAIQHPLKGHVLVHAGQLITDEMAAQVNEAGIEVVTLRSVYKCRSTRGICQKCYGVDLATGRLINIGEAVGIIAAQSIGEPGTQLTMRTFHTGGVDLRKSSKVEIRAKHAGVVEIPAELQASRIVENDDPYWVSTAEGVVNVLLSDGQRRSYLLPAGSILVARPKDKVAIGDLLAEYDPGYEYVVAEAEGIVKIVGTDVHERLDEHGKVVSLYGVKDGEIFVYNPDVTHEYIVPKKVGLLYEAGNRIKLEGDLAAGVRLQSGGIVVSCHKLEGATEGRSRESYRLVISPGHSYPVNAGASFFIKEGDRVSVGEVIARERISDSDASKTKDIVQGLPRVEELFEARRPKDCAVLSEMDGIVELSDADGYRLVSVTAESGARKEVKIPFGVRLKVYSGKVVRAGDQLTDGVINPHDVLETKGVFAAQTYLSNEIQKVYTSQGVQINSKHIEVIVRQMTRKIAIISMGDSSFLPNELIDSRLFDQTNLSLIHDQREVCVGERVLLGITRASLNTESFVSASSFQQTASVLTKAALEGQSDPMEGLKENVIIGRLIPAGTGMPNYAQIGFSNVEYSPRIERDELFSDDSENLRSVEV